ncbi:MAG TPA: hypothetical protein VG500_20085 [Gemmatimonadales bacterium]|jgi:hypothetical protein|nr:hypothetical protein [Gemmatimonadales bacterium]
MYFFLVVLLSLAEISGLALLGDFEDIGLAGRRVFLVTSAGDIVAARAGADGETAAPVRRIRGHRGACEVEGRTWDEGSGSLAIAPDLTLLINDEAAGRIGTITGYAFRP